MLRGTITSSLFSSASAGLCTEERADGGADASSAAAPSFASSASAAARASLAGSIGSSMSSVTIGADAGKSAAGKLAPAPEVGNASQTSTSCGAPRAPTVSLKSATTRGGVASDPSYGLPPIFAIASHVFNASCSTAAGTLPRCEWPSATVGACVATRTRSGRSASASAARAVRSSSPTRCGRQSIRSTDSDGPRGGTNRATARTVIRRWPVPCNRSHRRPAASSGATLMGASSPSCMITSATTAASSRSLENASTSLASVRLRRSLRRSWPRLSVKYQRLTWVWWTKAMSANPSPDHPCACKRSSKSSNARVDAMPANVALITQWPGQRRARCTYDVLLLRGMCAALRGKRGLRSPARHRTATRSAAKLCS